MTITVLMPLKGRPRHTLRWMWHYNRIKLPFKVLIADGGSDVEIERLLSEPRNFPNLNYRYLRYDDRTVTDFYAKMVDATSKIDTPYVAFCDNDDFLLPEAILRAGQFLDANPDYVSAGGHTGGFTLWDTGSELDHIVGDFLNILLLTEPYEFEDEDAVSRLKKPYSGAISFYRNVNRTEVVQRYYTGLAEIDPVNFDIWEHFHDASVLVAGRAKLLPSIIQLRQMMTSMAYASMDSLFTRIMFKNWVGEVEKAGSVCGAIAEQLGTARKDEVAEAIRRHFHDHFRTRVGGDIVKYQRPTDPITRLRGLLKHFSIMRRTRFSWLLNTFVTQSELGPADAEAFRREFAVVSETLMGPGFPQYYAELKAAGTI